MAPTFNKEKWIGKKFGRLTVLDAERKANRTYCLCVCECGDKKEIRADGLANGTVISCGCLHKEAVSKHSKKHGLSNTLIYKVWGSMRQRCQNPNAEGYENYGGRGIKVCDEWQDFEKFYEDMFPTYKKGLQLDRIDNNGNYQKDNCQWVTRIKNNLNKRTNHFITFDDETLPLSEMARKYGHTAKTVDKRLKLGWSIEKALTSPIQQQYVRRNK